jgi:hypothetical protein
VSEKFRGGILSFAVITSAPIVGNKVKRICVAAKKIDIPNNTRNPITIK